MSVIWVKIRNRNQVLDCNLRDLEINCNLLDLEINCNLLVQFIGAAAVGLLYFMKNHILYVKNTKITKNNIEK